MIRTLLILWVIGFSLTLTAQENPRPLFSENELYIGLLPDVASSFISEEGRVDREAFIAVFSRIINEEQLLTIEAPFYAAKGTNLQWVLRISISKPEQTEFLNEQFNTHAAVFYSERVAIHYLSYTPNDLGANSYTNQWHLYKIKAQEAWNYSKGSRQVKVAIVDDAMQITHPDLENNVWVNPGEIANNGIDDDQNGYIDDVHGYDVGGMDNDPMPNNNGFTHGTHCAGITGATTDNSIGYASIGFNITLIPVKCTTTGQTNTTSIPRGYEGITYAVAAGADIISCSWGSNFNGSTGAQVVQYAQNKKAIVVAAMGNDNNEQLQYPASYSGVISVAATANNDTRSTYSNYHSTTVISAPGNYIGSTMTNSTYGSQSGTSMATPLVAGLLGLMKSHMLGIEVNDLKNCLINSADNIDAQNSGFIGKLGSGRINAEKSLICVDNLKNVPPDILFTLKESVFCPGSMVRFSADSKKGIIDSFYWEFPGGIPSTSTLAEPEVLFAGVGTQSYYLTVFNQYGNDKDSVINGISFSDQGISRALSSNFETGLSGSIWQANNDNSLYGWKDVLFITGTDTNGALKLNAYGSGINNLESSLTSQVLDFTDYGNSEMTFNFAYARRSSTAKDSLFIEVSTDSGANFSIIYAAGLSADLNVSGSSSGAFSPVSPSQWCEAQNLCLKIPLRKYNRAASVMIRIRHLGVTNGNNLYLDNILVEGNCAAFNTQAAVASIITNQIDACGPVTVNFVENSLNFPSEFHWYFPGGIPAESTNPEEKVSYAVVGNYDVSLVVENSYGKDSVTWKNKVRIHALPTVIVNASDTSFCSGVSVQLTASGANSYTWSPLVSISSTTGKTITAGPSNNITYTVEGKDAFGCLNTATVSLEVLQAPFAPLIFRDGSRLYVADQSNVDYQWYRDSLKLDGANSFEHEAITSGSYLLLLTNPQTGCSTWSRESVQVLFTSAGHVPNVNYQLYPNPANTFLILKNEAVLGTYMIYNAQGKLVHEGIEETEKLYLNIKSWIPGMYIIEWEGGNQTFHDRFLIQH